MSTEMIPAGPAHIQQRPAAVAVRQVNIDAILVAAQDPQIDAGKLEALVNLYERMQATASRQAFDLAMIACQSEMPRVSKDGKIVSHKTGTVQSRFATLENIDSQVRPILERHGFAFSVAMENTENGKVWFRATVRHTGGHVDSSARILLSPDDSGNKNGPQGHGSIMSYARRYLLCAVFNIITEGEDTDAAPVACLNKEQLMQLETLIQDVQADVPKLLAWQRVGNIAQIPAVRFAEVMAAIKKVHRAAQ